MHRSRPTRGFTLLELIAVMMILTVVMAMAAPSLRGFWAGRQAQDAAGQIVALARWASSQAAADGDVYRLNLDAEEGTYWLTRMEGEEFVELGTELGRTFVLPQNVTLETRGEDGAALTIDFYPDGRCQVTAIEITGAADERVEIICRSPTEGYRIK